MEGNQELMLVVAVVGGLVAGFFIGWLSRPSGADKDRLEAELKRCREELDGYRNQVSDHFAKTAELVGRMTAQYRAVYEHLAEGAHRLGGEQANRLEAAIVQGESLLAGPEEASRDEETVQAPSDGSGEAPVGRETGDADGATDSSTDGAQAREGSERAKDAKDA